MCGSIQATDRLMKELRDVYRSDSFKRGECVVDYKITSTVEPLLSGHPWGKSKGPLNRLTGWPLNRGSSEISIRHFKKVTFLQYKIVWNETNHGIT